MTSWTLVLFLVAGGYRSEAAAVITGFDSEQSCLAQANSWVKQAKDNPGLFMPTAFATCFKVTK